MASESPAPEKSDTVSPWAPLRIRAFRLLWLGQLGSNVGVWMQTVAAQWFLVQNSHSSALVAWVQTASLLPVLMLSLVAGVLADSYDRRTVLLITSVASTVLAAVLTVFSAAGILNPVLLLAMTFLLGCTAALTSPAWQAIQPELVPREQITAAASLGSITVNAARAVGPAIAGFLVALTGPTLVFAINAASFLGVVAALMACHPADTNSSGPRERWLDAMAAGVRYVRSGPIVRRILLRSFLFAFPASALWALLPAAAQERLDVNASGYGVLLAVLGVGAILGVVVFPYLQATVSSSVMLAGSALLFAIGSASLQFLPLIPVVITLLLAGGAWTATLTTLNASLQLSLAGWVRARGMAVYLMVFMGSQAIGAFLWGLVAARIGASETMLLTAGLLVLTAVSVIWFPLWPETGRLDRTIAYCWPQPTLVFTPDPTDGPVTISVDYPVSAPEGDAFVASMSAVERSRRRTGAYAWHLYRAADEPDMYREQFTVRSWQEYQASHTDRWLGSDQTSYDAALTHSTGRPVEHHYFVVDPRR